MKKINWDALDTYDSWKDTLESLLDQAKSASASNNQTELIAISNALNTFVKKSFPNTPEIMALDEIAVQASQAMSEEVADAALMQISARTTRLTALAKHIERLASVAADDAASIRLEKAHAAVDALTHAMRTIDGLDDAFAEASDDELRAKIKDLATAMKKIRDAIEKKSRSNP
jgi:hypothetical protein